ncbi:MAG: Bacterial alpha-L-rhamnosidase [bacterium]|nr:Bacterial alpha-L-rhamnosidase [bacterium]
MRFTWRTPFLFVILCGAALHVHAAAIQPADPRCEYQVNPLAVETPAPRFSWRLDATDPGGKGQAQTAYQILVASSLDKLKNGAGDLWNSGEVESSDCFLIEYGGSELASSQDCYWEVRVRDEKGAWSAWSAPQQWRMGLLQPGDWKGQWIGIDAIFARKPGWPPPDNDIPDPWFRKAFTLKSAPKRALISLASIGYHELYVNGQKIGDAVLAPNVATHRVRARYMTYDITSQLHEGDNVIAVWMGLSWSIFSQYETESKPRTPMFIAQADITLGDGSKTSIVTDGTWKTHPSPNTLLGAWDFMHYGGELYDANKEIPNWNQADFDDSNWTPVTIRTPEVVLSPALCEPNRIEKEIVPVKIDKKDKGWRVDMGVNFVGYLQIHLKGKPGDRVDIQISEREDQLMTHRLHSAYIIGPSGDGVFRNRFNYGSGRWVYIEGVSTEPALDDIRGYFIRTDYQRAGRFECDDDLLNKIYETTLWTYENLSLGGYVVDCPQRERMGYGGDAHATTNTGLLNYRTGAMYTKWLQDWRDTQEEDGSLPHTAPTYWGGGGPGWGGICITLPWEMYRQYSDLGVLKANFPMMKRWLEFLETKQQGDILRRWGGDWDFLGDWLWPGAKGVNSYTRESLFFNNAYWVYNLETAAKAAEALGYQNYAMMWRLRAGDARKAINKEFYYSTDHSYANGFEMYLALALYAGLPTEQERPGVWNRLEDEILVHRQGHVWAGITGGAFLFKALTSEDRDDLIYTMVSKEDYPGWGYMIKQGATTIWEDWEARQSLLHSSYLYVGYWFIEGLGGIKAGDEPGYQSFVVKPAVLANNPIKKVRAEYDSEYGTIKSHWRINDEQFVLDVTVPPNTSATVYVPTSSPSTVQGDGTKQIDSKYDGFVAFQTGAGQYRFVSKL